MLDDKQCIGIVVKIHPIFLYPIITFETKIRHREYSYNCNLYSCANSGFLYTGYFDQNVRRRVFIFGLPIGLTALQGGCTRFLRDRDEPTATLGAASITNFDTEPHRFQLRIEREGERIHDSAHELDGTAGGEGEDYGRVDTEIVDCTWEEVAGSYDVAVRLDDGEWVEQSVNARLDEDAECVIAEVRYDDLEADDFEFVIHDDCNRLVDTDEGCPFAEPNL